MALKPDRKVLPGGEDIHWFMNEIGSQGVIVTHDTSGSGAAMDDDNAAVQLPTGTGDGVPAGLLLCNVVNKDLSTTHLNEHQNEVQLGGKVQTLTHGWVVTDAIAAGQTPTAGDDAYMASGGNITVTGGFYKVGKFLSSKDEDGYAKVEINLPN
jgi:hypothetical protein